MKELKIISLDEFAESISDGLVTTFKVDGALKELESGVQEIVTILKNQANENRENSAKHLKTKKGLPDTLEDVYWFHRGLEALQEKLTKELNKAFNRKGE